MRKQLCSLVLAMLLGGCSLVAADLDRTSEIAQKFDKPGVVACVDAVKGEVAKLRAIREEESKGLLSSGLKLYLYDDQLRASETVVSKACNAVVGAIVLRGLRQLVD